ncbi:helix-turn-helix domain-containing protein [Rhodoferax sp.]|uniref:helix-turn-helix domain-containing protein n=1 Tax=Rhodoferax sp. TaxID=50421 RepID=UPI0027514BCF|nr:helix-turn-helix domain-containing protein [Rhodoferax sp.]
MSISKKPVARATTPPPPATVKARLKAANGLRKSGLAGPSPHEHGTSLSKALGKTRTRPVVVMPGLLYEGCSTFVRVANGVDAQMYAATISVAIAAGLQLGPYGNTVAGTVLFVYGLPIHTRVMEQFELLSDKLKSPDKREAAVLNLNLYRTDLGFDNEGSLSGVDGRRKFDFAMPPDSKLVVFFDVARSLRKRTCTEDDFRQFGETLDDLNESGIATLVFYRANRKTDAAFADEFLADSNGYTLELTEDRGAPREYGTGFHVRRRKTSEHDTVPTNFQVWYTVMNNELNFGWECRAPDDASNHKQIEIAERQKRVADLLESGMQQKDIAATLGVNSATVSRDASVVKAKAKKPPKDATAPTTPKG